MLPASACMEVNVDIARYVVNPFLLYFNLGLALFHVYEGFRIFLHQGITLLAELLLQRAGPGACDLYVGVTGVRHG
jgi:hypothetical protein